jgi:NAD(P)-dependent dehydrogenase (short-subunit alcohol dehydrogenase family)
MDFDRTFAADPALWGEFARKAVADGNTVVMISRRPEEDRQTVAETLGDYADAFSQVLLVGGDTMKGDAAQAAGIEVDVWVDDSPQTITPAKPCDECEDKPKTRSRKK